MDPRAGIPTAAACCIILALACRATDGGDQPDPSAAEVEGQIITVAEIDEWIKEDYFQRQTAGKSPSKIYELRSRALERMIDERILEAEANRRNMSTDEVLSEEAEALGAVSDEQIAEFYEEKRGTLGRISLEEITPRIRQYLELKLKSKVVAALREKASYEIYLEPPRVEVAADGPVRGPMDAPVTIVEFGDFQCPYCQRALSVIREVLERYPNEVRLVFRHHPLEGIHPRALPAAEASACAHDQGKFWAYHDKLLENSRNLENEDLARYAAELGLDAESFETCVTERRFREKVAADAAAARELGITGTPAFFVNGILISGAQPVEEFVELIESELASEG